MKFFVLSVFLLATLNLSAEEKPALPFTLKDIHGKEIEVKPGHTKSIIVLNFWASWCASCVSEIPELASLQKAYPHAVFYGINEAENTTKAMRFKERAGYPYTILLDEKEEVGQKYALESLPQTVVIDAAGKVIFRGARPPKKL